MPPTSDRDETQSEPPGAFESGGRAAGEVVADRFEIVELAGRGALGSVYRARDQRTGADVALKLLTARDSASNERFAREARVLTELHHPGIVRHVDSGVLPDGVPYLTMEWLEGFDLRHRQASGPLRIDDAVRLAIRVAEALETVHASGFVHRDLKPSNLFLRDGSIDHVVLLDFGVARTGRTTHFQTPDGALVGTPNYMAPEQARGDSDVDARADVFALGCVLYSCLTGKSPFAAENIMAVLAKILFEETPRLREVRPEVSEALDSVVAQMMAKERTMRPASAAEAIALLRTTLGAGPSEDGVHSLTEGPAASTLTRMERRFCSVIAALPPPLSSLTDLEVDADARRSLASLFASFSARFEVLRDGVVVALIAGGESATDQATLAARCAIALLARWRGARVALATAPGANTDRLPVGQVIDRAARVLLLRDVARSPNGISIDQVTAALLDARFDVVRGEGTLGLRGERTGGDYRRTLLGKPTPCVGRARELGLLASVFEECAAEPIARVVLVTAPPGVGKSRLRYEFCDQVRAVEDGTEVWMARGDVMSAGSPFGLLAQALRRAAGVLDGEPAAVRRDKLALRVQRHVAAAERTRVTEFLGELIGAPFPDDASVQLRAARRNARLMGDQMRRAWVDFLAAEVAAHRVVLVLEDLHWGDAATVSFVDDALRACKDKPLMVLALARPNLTELFPGLWATRAPLTLALRELSMRESEKLVVHVFGDALPEAAVREIAARSQGNAFYLEELIRSASEGGTERLPETVVAMVQARLLGFQEELRRVLRAASVYGEVFWTGGIHALLGEAESRERVLQCLDLLELREVVSRRRESKFPGEPEYTFRHSLVRDAAYSMLTGTDQPLGHRLASAWLEQVGERDPMTLAEHHERGEEPGPAAVWFERAAEQALEGNDLAAAVARAERGIACDVAGPSLGRLLALLTEALFWRGDYPAAGARGAEALPLLDRGSRTWCRTVARTAVSRARRGDAEATLSLVETLLAVEAHTTQPPGQDDDAPALQPPRADEDEAALVFAMAQVANQLLFLGRYELLHRVASSVEAIGRRHGARDPTLAGWVAETLAARAMVEGDIGSAIELMESASRQFLAAGDVREATTEAVNVGFGFCSVGLFQEAERVLRGVVETSERVGLLHVQASAQQNLGVAVAMNGAREEGRAILTATLETTRTLGDRRMEGATRLSLAMLATQDGRLDEAEALADQAASLAPDSPGVRAPALAQLATILLARGEPDRALVKATQARELLAKHVSLEFGDVLVRLAYAEALHASAQVGAAQSAIKTARDQLLEQAARIRDETRRRSFLANVPENARTLALAAAWLSRPVESVS